VCFLLAWVGSLSIALIFFSGHASGFLVNRFGCRVTTLLGGFLCALSLGVSSLAKNILILYLTYSVLYGMGTSCVFSASLNIIRKYFNKRRSMATGIVTCGQGGGVLILSPLLQTMIDTLGWQTTYRIMAGVVLIICLSGLTYSPDVQIEGAENASVEVRSKRCHIDVSVWKEPKFVAVVVSASVMMFGHYVPQIHLVNTQIGHVYTGPTNVCTDKNLHGSTLRLHGTGGTGRIFERQSLKCASLGPEEKQVPNLHT